MAVKYAVATGNWSNTAVWNGGSLPTSSDDVYANGFTVTIDGTYTVLTIRNALLASPVIAAGGQFIYANGGSLTCTASSGIIVGTSTTPCLEMTLASPNTATFNGSIVTQSTSAANFCIRLSNTGTLSLTGTYSLDSSATRQMISVTAAGTLNIVGSVGSSNTGSNTNMNTIVCSGTATINITGNITAGASSVVSSSTIQNSGAGTINITGNVTGGSTAALYLIGGATATIIGNVTGGNTQPGVYVGTNPSTISVTGVVTSGSGAPGIISGIQLTGNYASGTFVKLSGNAVNTSNVMAIVAPRITIDTATSSWLFQISTGGNRTLYAAGVALGNPATTDVRSGTVYGASSELTGTLAVPSPSNVLQGVATDATTGTLLMTPADFWNYLISSGFTTGSMGDRLQNASTVATTGSQIASYSI